MGKFKFKNYHRETVYLVDDVEVEAENLQEAKDKLLAYYRGELTTSDNIDVIKEDENVDFRFSGYGSAYTACCEDGTETWNGEFIKK